MKLKQKKIIINDSDNSVSANITLSKIIDEQEISIEYNLMFYGEENVSIFKNEDQDHIKNIAHRLIVDSLFANKPQIDQLFEQQT